MAHGPRPKHRREEDLTPTEVKLVQSVITLADMAELCRKLSITYRTIVEVQRRLDPPGTKYKPIKYIPLSPEDD